MNILFTKVIINFIVLSIICLINGFAEGYLSWKWTISKAPWLNSNEKNNYILSGLENLGYAKLLFIFILEQALSCIRT